MKIKGTKFIQAAFVQITGAIALFTGHLDGSVYLALSTLALGIYAAGEVTDKKLNPPEQ